MESDMLFSTDYPTYLDPIGEEHESRPHPLLHGLQKAAGYVGDLFAMLFVVAFTGLELLFVAALAVLLFQSLANWEVAREFMSAFVQSLSVWAR
jgi:hypothetical protein